MTHTLVLGVVAVSLFAAVSFAHLRSIWLAVVIAIGPFPGLFIAQSITQPFTLRDQVLIAAFSLVLSQLVAAGYTEHLVVHSGIEASNDNISKRTRFLGCLALIAFVVWPFWLNKHAAGGWIFFTVICALGSSGMFLLVAAKTFKPSERFISAVNRRRERSERILDMITPVAFSRWGFSVFGIGLILSAMALFGARRTWPVLAEHKVHFAVIAASFVALAAYAARDWRRTIATIFASAWLVIMETWASAFHGTILRNAAFTVYILTLVAALVPILAISIHHRSFARVIGVANEACAQAIIASGRSIAFATIGAFVFLVTWWVEGLLPLWPAFTVLIASAASLLIYPATAAVLESVFFRRRPAHERYKLK